MQLRVVNTGSQGGNCYLFEASNATLIVELGVAFKTIKESLRFDMAEVCGAIVTHEHGDHSKGILETVKAGIDVYASPGTIQALRIRSHRLHSIAAQKVFNVGPFKILPFDVKHDCAQPYGFLINHEECGNVLFVTDSKYLPYKFPNLHNIIIEANYSEEILNEGLIGGFMPSYLSNRIINSHMSIETCCQLLKNNDLTSVNNIVLIHLSDRNSHARNFKKQVEDLTAKSVHIADKGLLINFNKTPF